MNRMYSQYCSRNSNFNGRVSIGGHSLGSLITFDLLCNQQPSIPTKEIVSYELIFHVFISVKYFKCQDKYKF